ncbi:MAG: hypothetical protein ACC618_01585 [Patescibacteria group bacterium]
MSVILVKKEGEGESEYLYEVKVKEKDSSTSHKVAIQKEYYKSLGTKTSPGDVVRKSFEFLLKREPKESILKEFDLQLISNFFPEFDSESSQF